MKCLDFENENILTRLTYEQKAHLKECPKCRISWEAQSLERELVEATFGDQLKKDIEIPDIPDTEQLLPPSIWTQIEKSFNRRETVWKQLELFIHDYLRKNKADGKQIPSQMVLACVQQYFAEHGDDITIEKQEMRQFFIDHQYGSEVADEVVSFLIKHTQDKKQ